MDSDLKDCNLIVDCDEILVNISPKWARKILENREYYRPYLKVEELERYENDEKKFNIFVLNRPEFYLNKWLSRDNIEIPSDVLKNYLDIHNEEDFYYDLPITSMAIGLKKLANHSSVKSIYVISRHSSNSKSLNSKLNLIKSLFPEDKLIIRIPKQGESKADYVKDIDIEYGMIFEDEICNIKDYLSKTENVKNCYLYIPKFGYNIPDQEALDLILERNIILKPY